jgi:hypothetical protein
MKKIIVVFVLLSASTAFGQVLPSAPSIDRVISYSVNAEDGSVVRMESTKVIKDIDMLKANKAVLESQMSSFSKVISMSKEEIQAAHLIWEKYREPITKGVITVEQAVENITKTSRDEVAAMDKALE